MKNKTIYWLALILWIVGVTIPLLCYPQEKKADTILKFDRKYKVGETYKYRLIKKESQNGELKSTTISICELKVATDKDNVPYDEVHWLSVKVVHLNDTVDFTKEALLTTPYKISLDTRGTLSLPKIELPEMTEPITDFNTFFVAVGPQIGTTKLEKTGDSIVKKKPVRGDFSNGKNILVGEDLIRITVSLIRETEENILLKTSFLPPADTSLTYLIPEMRVPVVKNVLNNFQMVTPAANGGNNIQYGREYFYIYSTIRKSNGKIIKAEMTNTLNLKIKVNCNSAYTGCQMEVPFTLQRDLYLELL